MGPNPPNFLQLAPALSVIAKQSWRVRGKLTFEGGEGDIKTYSVVEQNQMAPHCDCQYL